MHETEPQASTTAELTPQTLLARAGRLMDEVEEVIVRAKASGDDGLVLRAQRELRESLSLAMRAIGMLADGGVTVNVEARTIEVDVAVRSLPTAILALVALAPTDEEAAYAAEIIERRRQTALAAPAAIEGEVVAGTDNNRLSDLSGAAEGAG